MAERKYDEFLKQPDEEMRMRDLVLKPGEIHTIHLAQDARAPAVVPQVTTRKMWFFRILGS